MSTRDLDESLGWLTDFGATASNVSVLPSESVKHLEQTVEKLQIDLMKEQTTNATLEEEVNKLKEENQRLQEESQTAAGELHLRLVPYFMAIFQQLNYASLPNGSLEK